MISNRSKRTVMTRLLTVVVLVAAGTVAVAQDKAKADPLVRVYNVAAADMFPVMGRAIAGKWKVSHSDKDLCVVTFEAPTTMTNSGYDATASCEPADGGTRVRIKARQKGAMSSRGREERFAKDVLDEIAKAVNRK